MKKPKKKLWVTLGILAAVVIVGVVGAKMLIPKKTTTTGYKTYTVEKQDLTVSIQGTGNIVSSNEQDVILNLSGEVQNLSVQEGDRVEKGQTLFTIYSESLEDSIDSTQDSIAQQQISNSKIANQLSSYKVYASVDGYVYNLKAAVGDEASELGKAYGGVCQIVPTTSVQLTCTASYSTWNVTDRVLTINQKVYVRSRYNGSAEPTEARVSAVSGTSFTVEIPASFANIGTLTDVYADPTATAYFKIGEGTVQFVDPVTITGSGKISKIYVSENQQVKKGDLLFEYDASDVRSSLQSGGITLNNLKETLAENEEKIADNAVVAPISGVISGLTAVEGGNVSAGSVAATIVDTGAQEIIIQVDELDIPKVQLGQKAVITVDALSDKEYEGTVTKIAELGTVSNSITTFDVTITVTDTTGIKVGMSASAEIVVEEQKDVIAVPVDYIANYNDKKRVRVIPQGVSVKDASTWKNTDNGAAVPYEWREVTVGASNDGESQILSGLQDGDVIAIVEETTTTSTGFSLFGGGGAPGGGVQGGPPSGGQGGPPEMSSGSRSGSSSGSRSGTTTGNKN